MLFFRSEEHLKNWSKYDPDLREGIISLPDLVRLFSGEYFKRRLDADYFSHMRQYAAEFINDIKKLEKAGSFWKF